MVVEPFNATWFGFLGVMAVGGVALHFALRHRPRRTQAIVGAVIAAVSVVLYTTFTFKSILNPAMPEVVLWQNLPFHFCNLVAWALIVVYACEIRPPASPLLRRGLGVLRTICYFPGALTGLLTLTSPVIIYIGHPLCSVEAIGFYGVHSVNVILGTLLGSLGWFRPTFRGAVVSVGYLAGVATLILPLDIVLRATVDPNVNYFYLFNPEDADILEMAHDLIPVPFVYMLTLLPVALAGTLVQATLYWAVHRVNLRLARRSAVA
jgi:hypothetical protein